MKFDHPSVFISYTEEDLEIAKKLYNDLKKAGVTPWLDKVNVLPGQNWDIAINQAIKSSSYFLLLLSSNSLSKEGFVQKEVKRAFDLIDELPSFDIFIIPVMLDVCKLNDERLQKLSRVDLFSYEEGLNQILRVVTTPKEININQYFRELKEQHRNLKREFKELGDKADITKAKKLLNEMRSAGKYIINPEQRSTITDLARDLGEIIFEASDEYPPVRLNPPALSNFTVDSTEQDSDITEKQSLLSVFLVLLLLIVTMVGVGYLSRNALFSIFEQYSKDFGTFVIYTGSVGVSLVSAVVIFGIMRSTGMFKSGKHEFAGATAGFLAMLMFLTGTYMSLPKTLQVSGNIRFVTDGKSTGPVIGARVTLSRFPGFETKTDRSGNFILNLPENQIIQEIELLFIYKEIFYYFTIDNTEKQNIIIKIPDLVKEPGWKWKKPFSIEKTFKDSLTGMEFVWVPGGCYNMGCNGSLTDCSYYEKPVHAVCLDGFWIGKYEVTQRQWIKIMESNPSAFNYNDDYPVETVSWNDAKDFIRRLNTNTGKKFRLPTEAEWEYACRSGGKFEKYSGGNDVNDVAWYNANSEGSTHPIGTKAPNKLEIYDMSGNVWEWCEDTYASDAYSRHQHENPLIIEGTEVRVVRGGAWLYPSEKIRSTYRIGNPSEIRLNEIGFRLVKMP
ncbi:MAG: SUMF1/EgtB/PvdO family nonheme iron enzyme [Desulfobacterales bacterium]|nr:SUMF1/EgtB/PvdO family nonheme iron enzyme [Desulfobacterales bacterium]